MRVTFALPYMGYAMADVIGLGFQKQMTRGSLGGERRLRKILKRPGMQVNVGMGWKAAMTRLDSARITKRIN